MTPIGAPWHLLRLKQERRRGMAPLTRSLLPVVVVSGLASPLHRRLRQAPPPTQAALARHHLQLAQVGQLPQQGPAKRPQLAQGRMVGRNQGRQR